MDMKHMNGMEMEMMPRWFATYTGGPFLIRNWRIDHLFGLVAAMVFSIVLSFIFECANYLHYVSSRGLRTEQRHRNRNYILVSLLRTFSLTLTYVTMLCAMTFNIWILISVVVGSGVGHLIGRPLVSSAFHKKEDRCDRHATTELLHDFVPLDVANSNFEKVHNNTETTNCLT